MEWLYIAYRNNTGISAELTNRILKEFYSIAHSYAQGKACQFYYKKCCRKRAMINS
ncbi:MAG: hypothetical protein WDO15_04865 [Bacteroidota bacterium]